MTLSIIAGAFSTGTTNVANATRYGFLGSGGVISLASEGDAQTTMRSPGIFSNLYIKLNANSCSANTTFSLRDNAATVTEIVSVPTATTGEFEDISHTDTITAGHKYDIMVVPDSGSTGTVTATAVRILFNATTANNTVTRLVAYFGSTAITAVSSTFYGSPQGWSNSSSTTELKCRQRIAGTMTNLQYNVVVNTRTAAVTCVSRHATGGGSMSNGNLTVSLPPTTTGFFEDTTNVDNIAAGDDFGHAYTTGSDASKSMTVRTVAVDFTSTSGYTQCEANATVSSWTVPTSTAQLYYPVSGRLPGVSGTATETDAQIKPGSGLLFRELTVNLVTNSTGTGTLKFRKNGADGNMAVSVPPSTTGVFSDSARTDYAATSDEICYSYAAGNTSGVSIGHLSSWAAHGVGFGLAETISVSDSPLRRRLQPVLSTQTTPVSELLKRKAAPNIATQITGLSDGSGFTSGYTTGYTQQPGLARIVKPNISVQTVVVGESLTRFAHFFRALTETKAISELLKRTAKPRIANETTPIGEGITRTAHFFRSLSETVLKGETLLRKPRPSLATQTVSVSELLTRKPRPKIAPQATAVNESVSRFAHFFRSVSDSKAVTDAISRKMTHFISQTTLISELQTRTPRPKIGTESVSVSDAVAKVKRYVRSIAEPSVIISDLVKRKVLRKITDLVTLVESLSGGKIGGPKLITVSDTVLVSDAISRGAKFFRKMFENALSLQFNGLSTASGGNYVQIPVIPLVNTVSISAWVKFQTGEAAQYGGILGAINGHTGSSFTIHDGGTSVLFQITTTATVNCFSAGLSSVTGSWHHFLATYDGSNMRLYVDGVLKGGPTAQTGNLHAPNVSNTTIGLAGGSNNFHLGGNIGEIAIYNTALSSTDASNSFSNGIQSIRTGMVAYYKLNEGSSIVAYDYVGTNNGTLINSPVYQPDVPSSQTSHTGVRVLETVIRKMVPNIVAQLITISEGIKRNIGRRIATETISQSSTLLRKPIRNIVQPLLANYYEPLYIYPNWYVGTPYGWTPIINAAAANPTVRFFIIINVNSGPDSAVNTDYTHGIADLQTQPNIVILGYVATVYGTKTLANVQSEIDNWASFYPTINGIMLDEMDNVTGHESYYSSIMAYAHAKAGVNFQYVIGNPGNPTISSYVGTVDTILIFENVPPAPNEATLQARTFWPSYSRNQFGLLVHDSATPPDPTYLAMASQYVNYIGFTDGLASSGNPYAIVPSYIEQEVESLRPTYQIIEKQVRKVMPNIATQTIVIGDALVRFTHFFRSIIESKSITDLLTRKPKPKIVGETVTISEQIKRRVNRFSFDAVAISELLAKLRSRHYNIAETTPVSDSINRMAKYKRTIQESVRVTSFLRAIYSYFSNPVVRSTGAGFGFAGGGERLNRPIPSTAFLKDWTMSWRKRVTRKFKT